MPFYNAQTDELPETLKTQVCIIGAGAAEITLARKLTGVEEVILVDSGDFGLDGATQSLYTAKNVGLKYLDLLKCRLRYFGGTTNHWNGYCKTNDIIDYEGRKEIDLPRWPVQHEDLERYIDEARIELGLSYDFFDNTQLLQDKRIPQSDLLESYSPDLQTKVFQLTTHMRFSSIYKDSLEAQDNLKIIFKS